MGTQTAKPELSDEQLKVLIAEAVSAGHVTEEDATVVITADASPDGKRHEVAYTKRIAKNRDGALALEGGVEDNIWTRYTESADLKVRAAIRQRTLKALEGPEKSILAAAKAMLSVPEAYRPAEFKGLDVAAIVKLMEANAATSESEATQEAAETQE
jgi:hypothetical protein